MKRVLATCLAAGLSILSATSVISPASAEEESSNLPFPLQLFQDVAKDHPTKNVLISPFSISTALSMAYNGAAGDTKKTMAKVLGFAELGSVEEIATRAKVVLDSLKKPGSTTKLEIANALFGDKNIKFKPDFLSVNQQYFDAEIQALDFKAPEAVPTINTWVSDKTQHKIPTIIENIPGDAILYLINAIYFKGTWEHKFDKAETKQADFHLTEESTKKVPMMHLQRDDFMYYEAGDFQVINLPYADGRLSMYIILPGKQSSLAAFEGSLTKSMWSDLLGRVQKREGKLELPRFKIADNITLKEVLSKMGMEVAFDPNKADFSEMAEVQGTIYISQVFHKTFMELNEEGTEAAAVTAVQMTATSAMANPPPPFEMIVNRPFVLALRDNKTDSLLFVGHIADPGSGEDAKQK